MFRGLLSVVFAFSTALVALAAEREFDIDAVKPGTTPAGWSSQVAGKGKPGEWTIQMDEVPTPIANLSDKAPKLNRRAVLAQSSHDIEDEHFPILLLDDEKFGDFQFTSRFKITGGSAEQMAGLVFRAQNASNFYVVRASALGGNIRFYKFVDGERSVPLGPDISIEKGKWYELGVSAQGNRIQIKLDGREIMPALQDNTFNSGKIGFFTKSDATAVFADAKITYQPLERLSTILVRDTLQTQSRLLDLRIYVPDRETRELTVAAAKKKEDIGLKADETENKVFKENQTYFAKTRDAAIVTAALHDRNGEVAGVIKFFLKPYPGQTESATITRVLPTIRRIEMRVGAAKDLVE